MTEEKLLDHDADGIKELDNPLPSWWVYLFFITIVFAFYYFVAYSFIPTTAADRADQAMAQLIADEQEAEQIAIVQQQVAQASGKKIVTPVAVKREPTFPDDADSLALGKQVFDTKCFSCHGMQGEGLIGPNFTDKYWIHGKGELKDIYDVIVKGVPAKGMISWGPLMKQNEIEAVSVYIKTFEGTNPPNQKAPEGTLVE